MPPYFPALHAAILAAAAVTLVAAAYHDMRSFRIPNVYCLILLLLFPAMALTAPASAKVQVPVNLAIFAAVLAAGMLLHRAKILGGGDAKLIAALSLWPGPSYLLPLLFYIAIAGGLLAFFMGTLTYCRSQRTPSENAAQSLKKLAGTPLPYGIAIAIGGIVMVAHMAQTQLVPPNLATG